MEGCRKSAATKKPPDTRPGGVLRCAIDECGHGPRRARRRAGIRCTLRVTRAMAAGVTDRLWEVSDLVACSKPMNRG
jgi:hypothetical protein